MLSDKAAHLHLLHFLYKQQLSFDLDNSPNLNIYSSLSPPSKIIVAEKSINTIMFFSVYHMIFSILI